uniref:Uncharacterized protein n=1 Tax=Rhizophora mucronata TaxID=61149 RepID=A0A2P2QMI0_RHIMU
MQLSICTPLSTENEAIPDISPNTGSAGLLSEAITTHQPPP